MHLTGFAFTRSDWYISWVCATPPKVMVQGHLVGSPPLPDKIVRLCLTINLPEQAPSMASSLLPTGFRGHISCLLCRLCCLKPTAAHAAQAFRGQPLPVSDPPINRFQSYSASASVLRTPSGTTARSHPPLPPSLIRPRRRNVRLPASTSGVPPSLTSADICLGYGRVLCVCARARGGAEEAEQSRRTVAAAELATCLDLGPVGAAGAWPAWGRWRRMPQCRRCSCPSDSQTLRWRLPWCPPSTSCWMETPSCAPPARCANDAAGNRICDWSSPCGLVSRVLKART